MYYTENPELITAPVRTINARVRVFNGSTLVYDFTKNDSLQSITITRAAEKNKFFGFGICQKLNFKLRDPQRAVNITTAHTIKINIDQVEGTALPFPTFKVTEVHRDENTNQLSITAYDPIYWASQHTLSEVTILTPYTIRNYARSIAFFLGIDDMACDGESFNSFEYRYPKGANVEGTETLRALLDAIAEATQTVYYIRETENGQCLFFRRLQTNRASLVITKEDYFTLSSKTNRRLSKIYHTTELGDDVFIALDETGTTQYVRDNPFWELEENIDELLQFAIDAVGGLTLNQFECSWRGNYMLEPCDCIGLETKEGTIVYSCLLNDTIEYDGSYKQKTLWQYDNEEFDTAENPASLGEALKKTFAKVNKIDKEIDLVASDVAENSKKIAAINITTENISQSVSKIEQSVIDINGELGNLDDELGNLGDELGNLDDAIDSVNGKITKIDEDIAQLTLTTEGITGKVSNLEKTINDNGDQLTKLLEEVEMKVTAQDVTIAINKELENGVNKVVTSTGFTFDDDGLTVEKSDSEMKTQITEDGMTVYRNNDAVLVANNEGVYAEDLHATTYLIIGRNSRFEDYLDNDGNERTGCFWIGN